jgi:outer membrane protein OmpA-like peptidoglycan-associated protein
MVNGSAHNADNERSGQVNFVRRAVLCTGLTLLLAACASHPAGNIEQRREALRALGFVEVADGWEMNLSVKLLFGIDSSALSAQGLAEIKRIAPVLAQVGVEHVRVDGHTDNIGSDDYNVDLSLRRAQMVSDELRRDGLTGAKITARAMAKANPIASNDTPEGRQQNRRVVLIVEGV